MDAYELLSACTGFDWDEANVEKNWKKHHVAFWECEQIFFNQPLVVQQDPEHSQTEKRFLALGQTHAQRWLFVAFTVRCHLIRVISARDMTKRETAVYKRYEKKNPSF